MARYTSYRRKRKKPGRFVKWLIFLAIIATVAWLYFRNKPGETDNEAQPTSPPQPAAALGEQDAAGPAAPVTPDEPQAGEPQGVEAQSDSPQPQEAEATEQQAQAMKDYQQGMEFLRENKLIMARDTLSKALLSENLAPKLEEETRLILTELAEKTIFSRKFYDGDPYAIPYTFLKNEFLANVERKLQLHVPYKILLNINGIRSARRIRAGQTLKMIKGPFHAIVYKKLHAMDLYLHREGLAKVFIRRVHVGLGRYGATPVGSWRIATRTLHGDYFPSPNSPLRKRGSRISYGQPGYAFGKKGIWIGLKGTDATTMNMTGYGIHSTDDPSSIGKDISEGCIRLGDDDIELVYALLYEKWSTVIIKP